MLISLSVSDSIIHKSLDETFQGPTNENLKKLMEWKWNSPILENQYKLPANTKWNKLLKTVVLIHQENFNIATIRSLLILG